MLIILVLLNIAISEENSQKGKLHFTSSDTEKVWIYLDKDLIDTSYFKRVIYPERTIQRLEKIGQQVYENISDYYPTSEIIQVISGSVIRLYHYSRSLCAFSAEINENNYKDILNLDFVEKVEKVKTLVKKRYNETVYATDGLPKMSNATGYGNSFIQLNQLRIPELHSMGLTGKGVRIALIDAGFSKTHNAFRRIIEENRLIAEYDFIFNDNNVENENEEDYTYNQSSHGTAVWSLVGGYVPGILIGAAYDAEFLLAKTERIGSETRVEEDNYVKAIEWADSLGADIISTSLAYRDFDDGFCYPFEDLDGNSAVTTKAVNWAYERGILFVTAAGNDGNNPKFPDGGLYTPGDAFGALTIGAVDSTGTIARFSSHGPTADGRIKPDLCAMGVHDFIAINNNDNAYGHGNGTSLSTPLITGASALILEKHPNLSPDNIVRILKKYASLSDFPDSLYGWGIPDVYKSATEIYPNISLSHNEIAIFPNPSTIYVNFLIEWQDNVGSGEIMIYNLAGKLIWKKTIPQEIEEGRETIIWDIRDQSGLKVSSGVYIVRFSAKGIERFGKFVIVH